jgi:effector-binding domain-containing protein
MRYLKLTAGLILSVAFVTTLLSLLTDTKQTVDRSITINAPAAMVYEKLSRLEYFNRFSVWSIADMSAVYTQKGTDGTVGASTSWKGDPYLAGEGSMEITALDPGKSVSESLHFTKPKKANATSLFTLSESNGITTVHWHFELATPRPWNIFNLFSSLDKKMGPEFEKSLNTLRDMIQATPGLTPAKDYPVELSTMPSTSFLEIKQQIRKDDISAFFAKHLPLVKDELLKKNLPIAISTGIIYSWDPGSNVTDYAAAIPIPAGTINTNPVMQVDEIAASKVVRVTFYGSYKDEADAYGNIEKYIADKKLKRVYPVLEQYVRGPLNEPDTAKWETQIIVRVEE